MIDVEFEVLKQFVKTSDYRYRVLCSLSDEKVMIPTDISRDTGIRTNHISKVLGELKQYNLIECLNEDSKKGRLYRLTSIGAKVKKDIIPVSTRYFNHDGLIYDSLSNTYYNIDDAIDLLNMKQ